MKLIFPERPLGENVLCFTTSRDGGVSVGPYDSFNLATHVLDELVNVRKNRKSLIHYLTNAHRDSSACRKSDSILRPTVESGYPPILPLRFLQQTHSSVVINYAHSDDSLPCADAIFSHQLKAPLAVLTADCLPIVLCSQLTNECAAIHAGWKGLANGIVQNTVNMFSAERASISAWIGPSICQHHFEVGKEVATTFKKFDSSIVDGTSPDKFHVDLSLIAQQILHELGVKDVQQSRVCTYCRDDLFSFRQAKHNGLDECGRMATVVIKY